jgi:hypothetical protein
MKVVINKDKQSYDAFLEIIKSTALAEPTRFTLVLDQEVWSLHFNATEVQSVSQSQLDNRKVYLQVSGVELGLTFQNVYRKHQFM